MSRIISRPRFSVDGQREGKELCRGQTLAIFTVKGASTYSFSKANDALNTLTSQAVF